MINSSKDPKMRNLANNFDFLFRMRVPMMEEGSAFYKR